ncbi:hypothetical protein [Quadrisphaera sp. INWT6]|uniref:hypothetical protein n=1 Tax=Quadrisphaera sp. INWT6 TaxID=2596917 RepID=UPI0018920314|nr:hypothetical protein [Quadrisphaera sp. INWT6]MBF5081208.1 hypothetical protein [Quadrisphaera sp. INWT6]
MTLPLDQVLDLATGGLLELCGVLLLLVIAARVRAARASARRRELAASAPHVVVGTVVGAVVAEPPAGR